MRIKNSICLIALIISLTNNFYSSAQTKFPVINKDALFQKIDADTSSANFFMVATFVNYCSGMTYLPQYLKMMDSITNNRTRYFICQSSHDESDRGNDLEKALAQVGLEDKFVYLIDSHKYPLHKKDGRKQGEEFRNDLCTACQFSVTSGTYYIIFNKNKIIMYSGYVLNSEQLTAILTCEK